MTTSESAVNTRPTFSAMGGKAEFLEFDPASATLAEAFRGMPIENDLGAGIGVGVSRPVDITTDESPRLDDSGGASIPGG